MKRTTKVPSPELPPHDPECEAAVLSCVLLAGEAGSQAEVDSLLEQLRPNLFYEVRHRDLLTQLTQMRMAGHAVDNVLLYSWLKREKKLEECGGESYVAALPDKAASFLVFHNYLPVLREMALRRWCLAKTTRLGELAKATEISPEALRSEFSDIYEKSTQMGTDKAPLIHVVKPSEARAYVPDPADYMVGEGLITRGMVVLIGGKMGVGKSRLATTLAIAGARGTNRWMGYPIRSKWRTLVLQTENDSHRLKEECDAIPAEYDDQIKFSDFLSHGMAFDSLDFRREVRRIYDKWPFDMLAVDPWNDISFEESQKDYKQALVNMRLVFSGLPKLPAMVIVAHLRKSGRDESARRKTGRELLDEISGSFSLASTCRTAFILQAAVANMEDGRVIFEVAKANNCHPDWLKEHGTRSAWMRANGAFESVQGFDWEEFDNPSESERRKITDGMLMSIFEGKTKGMKATGIVRLLMERYDVGEKTAYRAIAENGYLRHMLIRDGTGTFTLKATGE